MVEILVMIVPLGTETSEVVALYMVVVEVIVPVAPTTFGFPSIVVVWVGGVSTITLV